MLKFLLPLLLTFTSLFSYEYELAVLAIFQNEARFMKEWIEYNKLIGVDHFYLINHFSEDNYQEILQPYIDQGIVELFQCDDPKPRNWLRYQTIQYNTFKGKLQQECKWVAVIDLDEFIVPTTYTLTEFLADYESDDIAGVHIFWINYGTSNVEEAPLLTESLVYRAPDDHRDNKFGKTILKADKIKQIGIHLSTYTSGQCITPDGKPMRRAFTTPEANAYKPDLSKIRINHYWTKDEKFYRERKLPRYQSWRLEKYSIARYKEYNMVFDPIIHKYLPDLKERLLVN